MIGLEGTQNKRGNLRSARMAGFTLLELMIVLILITVLVAMAVPSYQQYLQRSHRATALEQLMSMASCQQRNYATRFHFDTRLCLPNQGQELSQYDFRFEPSDTASTTVFRVIASPKNSQLLDQCGELILDQSGWRGIGGPQEMQRKCWEGR